MKTRNKTDITLPLTPTLAQAAEHALIPEQFATMYLAGFEAGYGNGRQAGYQQGFTEGNAAVQPGPNGASVTRATEDKPAPKHGPRRMLLGMPCKVCRVYLLSEETHCPCCKQPVKPT